LEKIAVAIIAFALVLIVLVLIRGDEDTWICHNNQWIKHGQPRAPMPSTPCGESQPVAETDIIVDAPLPNQKTLSPIIIIGKARGTWYFEASFPIRLLDPIGNEITSSHAEAKGEWMTENFVPFKTELIFNVSATTTAELILQNDNPSGLPEYDKQIKIPLILIPDGDNIVVNIYFNNSELDPEFSCSKVFAVKRSILKTPAVARATMEELLKGATASEERNGYITNINQGVKIQKLIIENKIAKIDFNEQLESQMGGSCRVIAIRSQITETLKQFPTVNDVIISINGRTEDILQP